MSAKVVLSLVVSVLVSISEINGAERSAICSMPIQSGLCRARMTQWGFDPSAKKCVRFTWGGCGKEGENRFETEELCKKACPGNEEATTVAPSGTDIMTIPGKCTCECPRCDARSPNPDSRRAGRRYPIYDPPIYFPRY